MNQYEKYYQTFVENNPYPRQLNCYDKQNLVNFSSNDYLGLSKHPLLIERSHAFAKQYGVGSASSRLVTGNLSVYEKLEQQLATALGKPAALILATGYQTNISVLEALLDSKSLGETPLVFCDRLCHVSMLAGMGSVSRFYRFQHNDLAHLRCLLEKQAGSNRPRFILAESIYSMEGDTADLAGLINLAKQYQAFLYIDDAHAVGVYGKSGWGLAAEYAKDIDMIMGTFSKGLGCFGAYVACSKTLREYLINKCKGLIYSTGLSPAILGAISAAIELVPQLEKQRQTVLAHAKKLRDFMSQHNLNYGTANSHIVPWIIGDAEKTLKISHALKQEGILAATIRPPSVAKQQSRIRFCLSAAHHQEDLEKLMLSIVNEIAT